MRIEDIEPQKVWTIFKEITTIPRCSGREQRFQYWVEEWSKKNELSFNKDEVGNILLSKKAVEGYSNVPTIIFQVHQDMICEKTSDSTHNFETDQLDLKFKDEYLIAKDTSLGADNGIGIALAMASLIDPETTCYGKLEVLMTVEEETNQKGALNVKKGFFDGKWMINLDSEKAGVIIVQSAGGSSTEYKFENNFETLENWVGKSLKVTDLLGGHSGVDIHLPRVNAIKLVSEVLLKLTEHFPIRICKLEGGTRENAIPRTANCDFLVKHQNSEKTNILFNRLREEIKSKYSYETDLVINMGIQSPTKSLSEITSNNIINLINEIPQGVISYSEKIKGIVQTSNNIGVIKNLDGIIINVSSRSSDKSDMVTLTRKLRKIGEKYNAEVSQTLPSYGWSTSPNSPLVTFTFKKYREILGIDPKITGIHGGLECSQFASLDPELQILSIGSTIEYPHTTREQLQIKSVSIVWALLKIMIRDIKQVQPNK